jgi:bromodomain and PHD finger-containing protein 1
MQVRKTAYCDVHSMSLGGGPMIDSGDDEDSKVKASHEQAEKSKMKIRMARKLLAERRNVPPVVSVPTIKPERLDRIANGLAMPKKTEFVRLLAAYWTLKRQSRNGVPLLRRLQSYNQNKDKAVVSSLGVWLIIGWHMISSGL